MDNIFRVVAEELGTDGEKECTPISQSYPDKRDAVLQYMFTKDYMKEGVVLLVSEYSVDEDRHEFWVRDLHRGICTSEEYQKMNEKGE